MTKKPLLPSVVRSELVTVVVVADPDESVTNACLERVRALDLPAERLEIVLVARPAYDTEQDAGGSAPEPRVVRIAEDRDLAAARNAGAEAARGEHIAFLAVDAAPSADWLQVAVQTLRANANNAAVATKIVGSGGAVAYAGAAMTFAGEPVLLTVAADDDRPDEALFAAEAALVVESQTFRWIGGFDEELAPGVEFADFGWRLWLHGFRLAYEPRSVVVGSATDLDPSDAGEARRILGSLGTLYKNYGEESFVSALATAMLAANATPNGRAALAQFNAVLPQLVEARRKVQAERVVGDAEILPLFRTHWLPPAREWRALHGPRGARRRS